MIRGNNLIVKGYYYYCSSSCGQIVTMNIANTTENVKNAVIVKINYDYERRNS